MATTSDNDSESTTTAVVTIRIPCGTDSNLVTDAKARLSRAESIADVTVDELQGIEPQLSATVITVKVTLHWSTRVTDTEARAWLADVPGLEEIH